MTTEDHGPGSASGRNSAVSRVDVTGGEAVIVLRGEVDLSTVGQVELEAKRLIEAGKTSLVFDFTAVTFFDSACLSALVKAREAALEHGGQVVLRNVGRYGMRILEITRLADVFEIQHDSEER